MRLKSKSIRNDQFKLLAMFFSQVLKLRGNWRLFPQIVNPVIRNHWFSGFFDEIVDFGGPRGRNKISLISS